MAQKLGKLIYELYYVLCAWAVLLTLPALVVFFVLIFTPQYWMQGLIAFVIINLAFWGVLPPRHPSESAPYFGDIRTWARNNQDKSEADVVFQGSIFLIAYAGIYFLVF